MVHGNEKMKLPCDFFECTRSFHFTLLAPLVQGSHKSCTYGGYETEARGKFSQTSNMDLLGKIYLIIFVEWSTLNI